MVTPLQINAIAEYQKRKVDALALLRPYANQEPAFEDRCQESIIIGGNRAGKTLTGAAKFAAAARDVPVTFNDGRKVHIRREHQRGKHLLMWVFGLDMNHIGKTIHRMLFRSQPAVFYIIRDEDTGAWRAYEPWRDSARKNERKPAPPLIPPSWVKPGSWSWENKSARNFEKVVIWNPHTKEITAEIRAWSSKSDEPPAGDPVDVIWIDETIKKPGFYSEYQARLLDNQGFMFWTSWPASGDAPCADVLQDISRRAAESKEKGDDLVSEHVLPTDENPHFGKEQLARWASQFSEAEYKARVKGEFQTGRIRMYPTFDPQIHKAIIDGPDEDDVSRILRGRSGEPPSDWTRELILDPGTAAPAVLLCAIPPLHLGSYYIPYREIYIPQLDAEALAKEVKRHVAGYEIERMIIDDQAGRQKPMGFRLTIQANYQNHFETAGVRSRAHGSKFIPGSADVAGRILAVIDALKPAPLCKHPQIRIVTEHCPNLCKQMTQYRKSLTSGLTNDFKPARGQKIDVAQCLEYGVSRKPVYVPPSEEGRATPAEKTFKYLMNKFRGNRPQSANSHQIGPAV